MYFRSFIFLVGAASAVDAAAARATLALAPVLFCTNVHDHGFLVALLSLDDVQGVAGSLLHALGLVSTVAASALVRHDLFSFFFS